jgi:hypothetical protein
MNPRYGVLYSPKCLEEEFCEVRGYGVLGSLASDVYPILSLLVLYGKSSTSAIRSHRNDRCLCT